MSKLDFDTLCAGRQHLILKWAADTFGRVARHPKERAMRLVEEALEVGQAVGLTSDDAMKILARTFSRPPGEIRKEVGGCAVSLFALAEVFDVNVGHELAIEYDRITSRDPEHWRKKHAEKVQAGTAVAG